MDILFFLTFKYNGVISISKKICRYGLVLPKKAQQLLPVLQKPSVFGNDSDDDDEVREPVFLPNCWKHIFFKIELIKLMSLLVLVICQYSVSGVYYNLQNYQREYLKKEAPLIFFLYK